MSLLTPIASTSKLLPPLLHRAFNTSLPRLAKPSSSSSGSPSAPQQDPWDIRNLEEYKFDDTTTVGHMILERQREELRTLMAIEQDRELLQERAKSFPFQPPNPTTHPLRLTSYLNLSSPSDPLSSKRKLRVPIAHLPLTDADSVRRFKLLAGSRWVLPKEDQGDAQDGAAVAESEGKEGWFEMSEEGWRDGRMNRKWLSDVLDKLIEEANNPSSPLTPLPLPPLPSHHTSRTRKQKNSAKTAGAGHSVVRREAMLRNGRGGGVKGFPEEWL